MWKSFPAFDLQLSSSVTGKFCCQQKHGSRHHSHNYSWDLFPVEVNSSSLVREGKKKPGDKHFSDSFAAKLFYLWTQYHKLTDYSVS